MTQRLTAIPVALETGSWPTFSLNQQARLAIFHGRGLSVAPVAPLPGLVPVVAAPDVALSGSIPPQHPAGPGGVASKAGGRTMINGVLTDSTQPSVPSMPHAPPGNSSKQPIRTSGPITKAP